MDEDRLSQPPPGTPPDEAFHHNDAHAGPGSDGDYARGLSRKVLFGIMGVIAVIFAFGSAWVGYQYASTSAIAKLGSSVSTPAMPAKPAAPAPTAPRPDTAMPVPPSASVPAEPTGGVAAGPSAPPTLPSAEELLADRKAAGAPQPAPAALVRDLPDWLATEVGGRHTEKAATKAVAARMPETSGASGDEPAPPARQRTQRNEPPVRQERAAAVFARCPKPGESGAVECRRAVCDGAARKQAVCAAYLN